MSTKLKVYYTSLVLVVVFGYHLAVLAPIQHRKYDNVSINPFTNVIIIKNHYWSPLITSNESEKFLNNVARRYFDIYAMVLPYKVIVE